jgi:septum formation protein
VSHHDRILEKPRDHAHAQQMLESLSGNTHEVITAVCICTETKTTTFHETSAVTFRPLTSERIAAYVATGEPMLKRPPALTHADRDKAGGFGEVRRGLTV